MSSFDYDSQDRDSMSRALGLARQGLYSTMPNPRVGCLIVSNGEVVGEGWHRRAGEPHAEILALQQAGARARGATVYVTLEPCSHTGRTGPCCEALISAGVKRVVIGMYDPNPQVSGSGVERIRSSGIEVVGPVLESECLALNPGFVSRMERQRPLVRCKMAMSLDGRTAMAGGESKWITGPAARSDVQRLRARSCAIVTGVSSVHSDDPSMNVREEELGLPEAALAASVQPLRVIVDRNQQLRNCSKMVQSPAGLLVVSAGSSDRDDLSSLGVEQWHLPTPEKQVDLEALLKALAQRGCNEVLVETGPGLAASFLRQGLLDELIVYMAPQLMGSEARPLFNLPIQTMGGRLPLTITDVRAVGTDWRITAHPDPES